MKKLSMDTNYNVIKEMAKELGVKFVGVKKEVIIEQINAKIEESKKVKKGKWFEQENAFPYAEGEIVFVENHKNKAINGRMFEIIGPSSKRNAIKGYLINNKNGLRQGTSLSLDFDIVEKSNFELQDIAQ